jgi:prepilin-type N-terminal cleavage/methylation domain-containing protein
MKRHDSCTTSGFTIVELLVVIVVIGILAAITIVSYSGITQKANVAAMQSDLSNFSQQLKMYYTLYSSYPTALDSNNCPAAPSTDSNYCLKFSGNNSITSYISNGSSFLLNVTNGSINYAVTDNSVAAANPGGIIPNGDFEYAPTFVGAQTVAGWINGTITASSTRQPYALHVGNVGGGSYVMFDSANAHSGSSALKIHTGVGTYVECRVNATGYYVADGIKVLPNTTYNYSIWMKSENVTGSSEGQGTKFFFSDGSGNATNVNFSGSGGSGTSGEFNATGAIATNRVWTQYTGTFTTGSSTSWFNPLYEVYGHTGAATLTGDFYFDDMVISRQ